MVNEDRARLVSSAHQEATKRLKKQFPAEYRALVLSVYEERGLKVRKRRTKEEMLADQLAEARRLLEEHS